MKLKGIMAAAVTVAMVSSCIHIPMTTAQAQTLLSNMTAYAVQMNEAEISAATEDISELEGDYGVVNIFNGKESKISFVTDETGYYEIILQGSQSRLMLQETLYNSKSKRLATGKKDGSGCCRLVYKCTAGEKYILGSKYARSYTVSESANISVRKLPDVAAIKMVPDNTTILEGTPDSITSAYATVTYSGGKVRSSGISGSDCKIDGVTYSLWVKDSKGSYYYEGDEGDMVSYADAEKLPAGTYTVQLTDKMDSEPNQSTKIYDSYTAKVQTPAEYFVGKRNISETDTYAYDTRVDGYEYYRFIPSATADFVFEVDKSSTAFIDVYDSDMAVVETDNDRYSFVKGKIYYVRLSGTTDDDNETLNEVRLKAKKYAAPSGVTLKLAKSEWAAGTPISFMNGASSTIKYNDKSTESIDLTGGSGYSNGNRYTVYYSSSDDNWKEYEYEKGVTLSEGEYKVAVGYDAAEEDQELLGTAVLKVVSIDKLSAGQLSEGDNNVSVGTDEYDKAYYSFVMPFDGSVVIESDSPYCVYESGDEGPVEVTGKLTGGSTYYVGLYNELSTSKTNVRLSFIPKVTDMIAVPENTDFIRMGSYDKDISSYVDGTRVKISYADGKTEELVFDDSDSVETSRGDEVRAEIVTDMENECPVGAAQIRIYTLYSEDSYAYDIEIKDIEDVAAGSLAEGSNQVSLSENGSVYYTFKPSTSARYTFAPVGGMEIYSKIDADDETMYDLKKLSVSDGEAALESGNTYYICLDGGVEDKWGDTQTSWSMNVTRGEILSNSKISSWKLRDNRTYEFLPDMKLSGIKNLLDRETLQFVYDDGSVKEASVGDSEDNELITSTWYRYNEKTGKYVEIAGFGSRVDTGRYMVELAIAGADGMDTVEIPFAVKTAQSMSLGTWNSSKTLDISGDRYVYVYKVSAQAGSYVVSADEKIDGIRILDANGTEITTNNVAYSSDGFGSAGFDTAGGDLYVCVYPGKNVNKCGVTMKEIVKAVSVSTTVSKTEYLREFDELKGSIKTVVTYSDGSTRTFDADDDDISFTIKKNGRVSSYLSIDTITEQTGLYEIIPSIWGMADDCEVQGASFDVVDLNVDELEYLISGEPAVLSGVENTGDVKLYRFDIASDGVVSLQRQGFELKGIYTIEDDGSFSDTYSSGDAFSLKKGSYIIALYAREKDDQITFTYHDSYVTGNGKITPGQKTTADISYDGEGIEYEFIPTETGEYRFTVDCGDNTVYTRIYADGVLEKTYSRNGGQLIIDRTFEANRSYTFRISLASQQTGSVTITPEKVEAEVENEYDISAVSISGCKVKKTEDGYSVTGDIKITYANNESQKTPFVSGRWTDAYGNIIQGIMSVVENDTYTDVTLDLRYKNTGSSEWVYAESKTQKFGDGDDEGWIITKIPTCTENGEKTRYIEDEDIYETEVIPATGHSFTKYESDGNATCSQKGTKTAKCDNNCGEKDTIIDDETTVPHDYQTVWTVKKKASQTSDGYKAHVCKNCKSASKETQSIYRIKSIRLAYSAVEYDGTAKKPAVEVKDSKGRKVAAGNYSVSYSNNKNIGKAKVVIKFKGDYEGEKTLTFDIKMGVRKVESIDNTANGIKLSWKKYKAASGYVVYRGVNGKAYTIAGVVQNPDTTSFVDVTAKNVGVKYTYKIRTYKTFGDVTYNSAFGGEKTGSYVPAVKLKKFTSASAGTAKVTYNKAAKATGYQIQYADNASFKSAKTANVNGGSVTSKTIKRLTKGKRYYVRVRSFKKIDGKVYYSAWSGKKSVVIKKR